MDRRSLFNSLHRGESLPSKTDAPRGLSKAAPFGLRLDGTPKGLGFFGKLKRPDGGISTEISVGIEMDGKEVLIPALVPTLDQSEIDTLLKMKLGKEPIPRSIIVKAAEHARSRMNKGLSPFAD